MNATQTNQQPYGIRAYGMTQRFGTEEEFRRFLSDWLLGTDGAEQARASDALANLDRGVPFTDTDTY